MTRRPLTLSTALLLIVGLAVLPACKKDKPAGGGGGDPPGPTPPAAVSSDYVLFAQLKAKDIRESPLVAEVKQAFAKAGGTAEWDQVEQDIAKQIGGVKPTEIDSVAIFVTEVPPRDMPKFVAILTASKPIDKSAVFGLGKAKPDARGFYEGPGDGLFHFPDDKTLVALHPALAQQYLDGYAKDRTGWPMTAELNRAAAGHTLYVVARLDKLPSEMFRGPEAKEFAPLLAAKMLTLTADLKGKEVSVGARATFPDEAAAGRAKDSVTKFIGMAVGEVEKFMSGKEAKDFGGLMPAIKEAHRALKEAKVEVSGSDLTIAGSYKADFDIGAVVADAVKRIREMAAQNNLKMIGIALHNHHDAQGRIPILGIGAKGMPLKNPNEKPLLSWRVAMLPYLEQQALYNEFKLDEPWDSEHNKKLIEKMPKIYAPVNKPGKPGYTHLQMVIGPNAMQPPSATIPASFPDGTSNTIAVIEAAEPVIWTKPDDVTLSGKEPPKDLKKKFGGLRPNGFNVLLWDGSVRFIPDTISDLTLGRALDPRDGQVLGPDW